ncbi:MAG: hypothetical protein LBE03_00295 [Candidatus Nomurabacteria bacterium]|jgi:hypothetical protein|nr:hypothetical protein [Candidatus Nomurabacteria bacterium]
MTPERGASANTELGYKGVFLERPNEHAKEMLDLLTKPPEKPLTDDEKEAAYRFDKNLSATELREGVTIKDLIKNSKEETVIAPMMFSKSFLEGKVQSDGINIPSFESHEDVEWWAAEMALSPEVDKIELREIFDASAEAYKEEVANLILTNTDAPEEIFNSMSVVLKPQEAIERMLDLLKARDTLKELRKIHTEKTADNLDGAKRALTDVYLSKINGLVAEQMPILEYVATQALMVGDEKTFTTAMDAMPTMLQKQIKKGNLERVFRNLDFLRNGVSVGESGKPSSVSNRVKQLIAEDDVVDDLKPREAMFSEEQIKKLKTFIIQPNEAVELVETILAKAGKLSSKKPDIDALERAGWASDDLWQVMVDPTKNTYSVKGERGLFLVGNKPRDLFSVLAVGLAHELTHVNQADSDRVVGESLSIIELQGKRTGGIREAGADLKQTDFEMGLSGKPKPRALTYAKALKAFENGGGVANASKAFYDEKIKILPDIDKHKAALEAVDRVMRLTRMGGINSQPMAYAEEVILADEIKDLPEETKTRALTITGLDFVDQVRLHKYGLLPDVSDNIINWQPLILEVADNMINKAINMGNK